MELNANKVREICIGLQGYQTHTREVLIQGLKNKSLTFSVKYEIEKLIKVFTPTLSILEELIKDNATKIDTDEYLSDEELSKKIEELIEDYEFKLISFSDIKNIVDTGEFDLIKPIIDFES